MTAFEARVRRHLALGVQKHATTFLASGSHLSGHVILGPNTSIWHGAVLRGDVEPVYLGEGSNVQDAAVLHNADELPCRIGTYTTIGHSAVVHACTIGNECLIGMGAIILDGSEIGDQCIIGAGALVTQNTRIPAGSLVYGSPARAIRPLTTQERTGIRNWAERYILLANEHRAKSGLTKRKSFSKKRTKNRS